MAGSGSSSLQSISSIVGDGKLDVVKIPDMALSLTDVDYKKRLVERFALSAQTKSVISALLLDKEEEWDRVQTNYGGLPMILHEFVTIVSAAADIPVSRLFGEAQGRGMQGGSTSGGPDDLRNYYDLCVDQQKNELGPRLGVLDQVIQRSALGRIDPNVHYKWNPLWQLSDGDKATIAYQKAQATQIYSTIGIINEDAFRQGVVNQLIEDGTYPGLDDAIEEFGSEPEEPVDMSGFQPGGGGGEPGDQEQASPNAEELGATG
jgi:phage-related protein (TIGR01555 family)